MSFPNQNLRNSRFLINHPQLSVIYHRRQIYKMIIENGYRPLFPQLYYQTYYDSVFPKPIA